MKDLVLKKLIEIHKKLVEEKKLKKQGITTIGDVDIYSNKDRTYFSFDFEGFSVSVNLQFEPKISEITVEDFDTFDNFSWSNWFEDLEKLLN